MIGVRYPSTTPLHDGRAGAEFGPDGRQRHVHDRRVQLCDEDRETRRDHQPPTVAIAPRHLALFSYLQFDGPMPVNELARRLEVAPATVSLMISDLSRKGLLDRREDEADRRRTIVSIAPGRRAAIEEWIVVAASAWQAALEPLTDEQRQVFVATIARFEQVLNSDDR